MSAAPRRSSRANKGTHRGRDILDVYYKDDDEPVPKKTKIQPTKEKDADFVPGQDPQAGNAESDHEMALEGDVRCDPCGTTQKTYNEDTDKGGTMIECEGCATWQHAACMGYKTKRAIPLRYLCNRCRDKPEAAEPEEAEEAKVAPEPETTKPAARAAKVPLKRSKPAPVDKTRASVTAALARVLERAHGDASSLAKWSLDVEATLHAWAGATNRKYTDKSRSVMAVIKKPAVFARLVAGELLLQDLVQLPPEEIDAELKDYAEKVRQELIRRSVLTVEDELSQRIRRTHKGEELVETPADDEVAVSMAARNIDHRVFGGKTEEAENGDTDAPAREAERDSLRDVGQSGPNLYQIADDDDDERRRGSVSDDTNAPQLASGHDSGADSDEELDFILGKKTVEKPERLPVPQPKLPPTMARRFWSGDLVFPDFVEYACRAEFVGCTNYHEPKDVTTASFHNRAIRVCEELLEKPRYSIEGRLDRSVADPYVEKITSSRDLYVVRIDPASDTKGHDKLVKYLASRKKVGVLSGRAPFVKDAYLYALDEEIPRFLQVGPVTPGLHAVFVVRKDYVPVGKSILKKALPPQPKAAPASNLDSILSKLAQTPEPRQDQYQQSQQKQQSQQNQHFHQQDNLQQNLLQNQQNSQQSAIAQFLDLTPEQLHYLSELVSQNPHVQQNPQALLSLLQSSSQMPGYY